MNKEFINNMEKRLLEEKAILTNATSNELEIDTDGDEADEIQANFLIELNSQLSNRAVEKINKINNALDKIKKNKYGICESCGEEIAEKRLMFNPYFTKCILCAEEEEKLLKGIA